MFNELLDDYFLSAVQRSNENAAALQSASITVVGTATGQIAIWDGTAFKPGGVTGNGATGVTVTTTTSPFGLQVALTTVPVANGGTGGTTQAAARSGLGLGTMAVAAQVAASADAAGAVSAAYVQAEVQAILNELRDLKTKMRTALALAP